MGRPDFTFRCDHLGIVFVAQRIAAPEINSTFTFNGLRFLVERLWASIGFRFQFKKVDRLGSIYQQKEPSRSGCGRFVIGGGICFPAGGTSIYNCWKCRIYNRFVHRIHSTLPGGDLAQAAESSRLAGSLDGAFWAFLIKHWGRISGELRAMGLVLVSSVFWAVHVILIGWMVAERISFPFQSDST